MKLFGLTDFEKTTSREGLQHRLKRLLHLSDTPTEPEVAAAVKEYIDDIPFTPAFLESTVAVVLNITTGNASKLDIAKYVMGMLTEEAVNPELKEYFDRVCRENIELVLDTGKRHPGAMKVLADIQAQISSHDAKLIFEAMQKMNLTGVRIWYAYDKLHDRNLQGFLEDMIENNESFIDRLNTVLERDRHSERVKKLEAA